MSVPAYIVTELTKLQAQVKAAAPLQGAPYASLKAIQLNVRQLETDTTLALSAAQGALDTWMAPQPAPLIIAGFQAAVGSAIDQWNLLDMLCSIGRAHLNIDLVIGEVRPPLGQTGNK